MPCFKDANGRDWQIKIDAPTIREVRTVCEINMGAMDGEFFNKLDADPVLLLDVLWVLCRGQANGTTDRQFAEAIFGDPLGHATKALTDAWLDFFPERKRSLLRSLADKQAAVTAKATALAMAKLNDPALEQKLLTAAEKEMDRKIQAALTSLNGATNSPESLEPGPKD
jgi:hypothetical protein